MSLTAKPSKITDTSEFQIVKMCDSLAKAAANSSTRKGRIKLPTITIRRSTRPPAHKA
jgi:hypothetical protein